MGTRGDLFKHLLSRYSAYDERIKELMQMYDVVFYRQMNVSGISFDRNSITDSPSYESPVIANDERKQSIVKEIQMLQSMIAYVDEVMKELCDDEQAMIREHYFDGMSYREMSLKRGVTRRTIEHSFEKIFESLC